MKYFIIVNPTSGRGHAETVIPEIENGMRARNLDFSLIRTERPWHAAELAEQAARAGYDIVVTASGDGTANEAINGVMHARSAGFNHTAMGLLPVGTGNDLAYGMGVRGNLEESLDLLAKNHRMTVDVGIVTGGDYPSGRYFANGVGIGFDAAAGFVAAKIRWIRGLMAYLIAALETIFIYYKAPRVRIQFETKTLEQGALMVSIMNGQRMGGGFYMAPNALPNDGHLDLCIAGEAGKFRILRLLPYFLKGTQASQPEIQTGQARKITITALKGTLPAHCDGETLCESGHDLTIEIIPQALEFLTAE